MSKILLVDDSGLSRRILRRILEPAGYEVLEAEDGMGALERYYLDRPDLVMLDMTMNGMHGLDVLAQLRQMDPQVAVIVATADIQDSSRELAATGGAKRFLTKPFSPQQVLDAVHAVLEVHDA
jgi:two-component system, chemotaxis family, chemotaxis protein CheY